MTNLEGLVIAYQELFEMVRRCEANEPPYDDGRSHRAWEQSLVELREDLGKAHLELDIALFVPTIPSSLPQEATA